MICLYTNYNIYFRSLFFLRQDDFLCFIVKQVKQLNNMAMSPPKLLVRSLCSSYTEWNFQSESPSGTTEQSLPPSIAPMWNFDSLTRFQLSGFRLGKPRNFQNLEVLETLNKEFSEDCRRYMVFSLHKLHKVCLLQVFTQHLLLQIRESTQKSRKKRKTHRNSTNVHISLSCKHRYGNPGDCSLLWYKCEILPIKSHLLSVFKYLPFVAWREQPNISQPHCGAMFRNELFQRCVTTRATVSSGGVFLLYNAAIDSTLTSTKTRVQFDNTTLFRLVHFFKVSQ